MSVGVTRHLLRIYTKLVYGMDSSLKRTINVQDGSTINCSLLPIVFGNLCKVSPSNKYLATSIYIFRAIPNCTKNLIVVFCYSAAEVSKYFVSYIENF